MKRRVVIYGLIYAMAFTSNDTHANESHEGTCSTHYPTDEIK